MKIFLTTMAMGIGGAETHVYELSLALLQRGHDVTIISAGGDFMNHLVNRGVKHIYAPMNIHSVKAVFASYRILHDAVKKEKPDIIHAHARIPAFVSHYVAKKFRIPFVTTDHGKFELSFLNRLMTKWGDKTIAVSEDLKEYLLENYNVKKENVFLTINGINTDVFTPYNKKNERLSDELNIPADAKVILTVSRLDDTAFRCSEELIECAKEIHKSVPKTRILIVGDGNLFDSIKQRAEKINSELGIEYIIFAGSRTDIYNFCSIADVFCGVSRAAMEAAASGKPILLAGNGAYFGVLNEKNLAAAESYNFTCRGVSGFDKEKFVNDIIWALNNNCEAQETSAFLRNYVINNLSAKKMTDDTENVYFNAINKKFKYDCVLLGYYGFGNMGDDALLMSVIKNIRAYIPSLQIAVLSHNSDRMRNKLSSLNIDTFNRFNPFSFLKILKTSKYLIFGGGTLLQDNTSTKSLLYYLFMIKCAVKYGVRVILYANGIGPIRKEKNRCRIEKILPDISLITARDKQSYDYIKSLNCKPNIYLTADEALTTSCGVCGDGLSAELLDSGFVCVSIRKWKAINDGKYTEYISCVSEFCKNNGLGILFIVMEKNNDEAITNKMSKIVDVPFQILLINEKMSSEELTGIMSQAKLTVSVRLHSLIFSACSNVPMIGLAYDPKVSAFMHLAGVSDKYIIDVDEGSNSKLKEALNSLYSELEIEKIRIKTRMQILKDAASKNAEITCKYILENNGELR